LIFPLLFLLPALFLARLDRTTLKRKILYALFFLTGVNLYMMLGFYQDLDTRIQSSEVLMPSFSRLEEIYQALVEKSASHRFDIDTHAYIDKSNRYTEKAAFALKAYVESHEQYARNSLSTAAVKHYVLLSAEQAEHNQRPVVYHDHSITIVE
jgi:hypothetical protein